MQYVYICGAVSEEICEQRQMSVAGNKFSLNMAKALDAQCEGNLIFVSTNGVKQEVVDKFGGEIWAGKKMYLARRGRRFVLGDLIQRKNVLTLLRKIHKEHPKEKLVVFVENSPFAAATACAAAKKRIDMACYSITIDTPFTGQFQVRGFHGHVNTWMFMCGRRAMKKFDGLVSFTPDVEKELQVDIPFCPLAIGCNEEPFSRRTCSISEERTAVYAGTLMYYNGTRELLQAFALLGENYQLHIYGYGPMEEEVKAAAQKYGNIIFHGRFDPAQTEQILTQYQLLINPRQIDPAIENFTFPSKLVDYILTGKSVLTTNFKTMPEAYKEFVYVLDDLQVQTIVDSVRRVFADDIELRRQRGRMGVQYVKENQTYGKVAERILTFVHRQHAIEQKGERGRGNTCGILEAQKWEERENR